MLRLAAIFILLAGVAQAQSNEDLFDDQSNWRATFGLGAGVRPSYRGSDSFKPTLQPSGMFVRNLYSDIDRGGWATLPFVSLEYRDLLFFDSGRREFGLTFFDLDLERRGRLEGALIGKYLNRRDSADDDNLEGLRDVSRTVFAGGGFTYSLDDFTLRTSITVDVADETDGAIRGEATLSYAWSPVADWTFRPRIGLELGDGSYNDAYFGIGAGDAANSAAAGVGLNAYDAPAGLTAYSTGVDIDYAITERFGVSGFLNYERLAAAAADSPLVDQVGSANQLSAGVFLTYKY